MSLAPSLNYRRARFLTSAADLSGAPLDAGAEVAFAGRSNAGKSSAINALTDNGRLARTSKTPGRTQLLNFFSLDDRRRLVDLPGYGYAKVPLAVKAAWQAHLETYLSERLCLRGLILVMDVRHPLQEFDRLLLDWTSAANMPAHVLLTKADKLSHGQAKTACLQVRQALGAWRDTSVQLFSSTSRAGLPDLQQRLDQWLQLNDQPLGEELPASN